MEINKRCITAFAKNEPFVALATKSKLFDPTFSLTSELILVNYMSGKVYSPITTDLKFCKIMWCKFSDKSYLAAGHENGFISIYEKTDDGLVLVVNNRCLQDDITALEFLVSKAVLVAASSKGKIIFWSLSDLKKDVIFLDVPLPANISSISCNPNVVKILCIGTTDGIIKVIDIKKLQVLMTLKSKDFTEVKQLEWDAQSGTKLKVMSEKNYITIFDLSNDSEIKVGDHPDQIIGFLGTTIISKNKLETNGVFLQISDSFECSISNRDPVVALSELSGKVHIMSIPVLKKTVPFCRLNNKILTKKDVYEITIKSVCESEVSNLEPKNNEAELTDNKFYNELISMINTKDNVDYQQIANFLLENADFNIKDTLSNEIEVDLNDSFTVELIKNNLENVKNCKLQVYLSVFDLFLTKDLSMLENINNFAVILVVSKILNNYQSFKRIKNARALAALILFHNINDYSLLESTKEGKILHSILTKNFGKYLDYRSVSNTSYLKEMREYENLLINIQSFIETPLESKKLTVYFWYQVFLNNLDKVIDLKVNDANIKFYLSMCNENVLLSRIKGINIIGNIAEKSKLSPTLDKSKIGIPYQPNPYVPQQTANSFNSAYSQSNANQMNYTAPKTNFKAQVSAPVSHSIPSMPMPSGQPSFNSIPNQSTYNVAPPVVPSQANYNAVPTQPNFSNMTTLPTQSTYPVPPKSPFLASSTYQQTSNNPIAPQTGFACPPKSPFSGPIPMNPLRNSTFSASKPASQQPIAPTMPITPKAPSPSPAYPQRVPSPIMNIQNVTVKNQDNILADTPENIISRFDQNVENIKQKAALNTSMILKHRKTQFLNALATYDSLQKLTLPASILNCLNLINKRFEVGGTTFKSDLVTLIENYSDVAWLKAFVELVKMVY